MKQEANSWGAAICGGLCAGLWKDIRSAQSLVKIVSKNEPDIQTASVYNELFDIFKKSYKSLVPVYEDLNNARGMLIKSNIK